MSQNPRTNHNFQYVSAVVTTTLQKVNEDPHNLFARPKKHLLIQLILSFMESLQAQNLYSEAFLSNAGEENPDIVPLIDQTGFGKAGLVRERAYLSSPDAGTVLPNTHLLTSDVPSSALGSLKRAYLSPPDARIALPNTHPLTSNVPPSALGSSENLLTL
ncbi:hypothetical protein C8J55DRAFT_565602 [Lentinula edodes]|uniref:Uncharacterized protein n=1 Tax=Lentinula lateritia TaxID=40482 RepID=A0A9W8ZTM9_9AGAR|nr:hypothetical protein C8J55DRAFT_565602 [Lentinula edodes]